MIPVADLHTIKTAFIHLHAKILLGATAAEKDAALHETAARIFSREFPPHRFDPADICLRYESTDENEVLSCRATFEPSFENCELYGGPADGHVMPLTYPHSSVTTSSGVGGCRYTLSGYNTETRRHIFILESETAA